MWATWWVWVAGAVGLGILEMLALGYIFLGFAIGAAAVGILLATGLSLSLPLLLVLFAAASLLAWFALRRLLGQRKGQVKVWDRDINED